MARAIPLERLAPARSAAQLLHRPRALSHPADIARAVCGVQAQDMRHGRLAFRARSSSLLARDVDHARTQERSLLHTWAMRNTLHLIASDDAPWLLKLFAPMLEAFARRRLVQLGLDPRAQEPALRVIAGALAAEGPLTRTQLHRRLEARGVPVDAHVRWHLTGLAVATGIACLGPGTGPGALLVATGDWLPPRPEVDRDAALAELARRYIRAFGPAGDHDFAKWSGLPLRDVRAGLGAIGAELREVSIGGARAWVSAARLGRPRNRVVRLLPAWDTYLLGYKSRDFMVTAARWHRVSEGGGMIAPTIAVDGVIAGTWRPGRKAEPIPAEAKPFPGLDPATRADIDAEIADIARFEEGQPIPKGRKPSRSGDAGRSAKRAY